MKIAIAGSLALLVGNRGLVSSAIADALAESGATVSLASAAPDDGSHSETFLEMTSPERAAASAAAFIARFGKPSLLVNVSAGVDGDSVTGAVTDDEIDAFALSARAFAPTVQRVINVISIAGVVPLRGAAAFSARQASLASLTRTLAMELAPKVIVNALAVGALAGNQSVGARLVSHSPLRRAGLPAEIGQAALFLADPANTYTTGHILCVDGGWSIGYARDF
jgi:NAD(P)-dependent dehydrogenase (short-subunit alcohol dehydrogenase family)